MIFVDGVVAEVHAGVPEVLPSVVVLDGGEPHESLLVQVDEERVVRCDEDVQPEVGLVTVDEERVVDVLPYHHGLVQRNLVGMVDNEDPPSSGGGDWLHNPSPWHRQR